MQASLTKAGYGTAIEAALSEQLCGPLDVITP
jgi:hypothetical protein